MPEKRIIVGADKRKTALFRLKKARRAATSAGPFGYTFRRYPSSKMERQKRILRNAAYDEAFVARISGFVCRVDHLQGAHELERRENRAQTLRIMLHRYLRIKGACSRSSIWGLLPNAPGECR